MYSLKAAQGSASTFALFTVEDPNFTLSSTTWAVAGGVVIGPKPLTEFAPLYCEAGGAGVGVSVGLNGLGVYEYADAYMPCVLALDEPLKGWNHITVVYRTKQPTVYVNGVYVKAGLKSDRSVRPVFDLGGCAFGAYTGALDNVRVYDRALSDAEIQADYNLYLASDPERAEAAAKSGSVK